MGKIELLDCTLRDGGHVNQARFGKNNIGEIILGLVNSNIDYVELGFLKNGKFSEDQTNFNDVSQIYEFIPQGINSTLTVMIRPDWYDISQLSPCDGRIEVIRFAFYYKDFALMEEQANRARKLGYRIICNPVNINGYSDNQLLELVSRVNRLMPEQLTMVDTYGAFTYEKMRRRYYLINENLDIRIRLGIHLHENMGLAFALAQDFLSIRDYRRDVVIDASLLGMGRIPGNLCIELIADFLNSKYGKKYHTKILYNLIGRYIQPIKDEIPWGYSPAYFITAKEEMHRSYAEYLLKKEDIGLKEICDILSRIRKKEYKDNFDRDFVEKLYLSYMGEKNE